MIWLDNLTPLDDLAIRFTAWIKIKCHEHFPDSPNEPQRFRRPGIGWHDDWSDFLQTSPETHIHRHLLNSSSRLIRQHTTICVMGNVESTTVSLQDRVHNNIVHVKLTCWLRRRLATSASLISILTWRSVTMLNYCRVGDHWVWSFTVNLSWQPLRMLTSQHMRLITDPEMFFEYQLDLPKVTCGRPHLDVRKFTVSQAHVNDVLSGRNYLDTGGHCQVSWQVNVLQRHCDAPGLYIATADLVRRLF